ncbi:TPA: amidohydrolase, partial [Candidatus Poribacteria bacterium]|nr:amidohydrolase [Candidatus Poribacteria bacterium]
MNIINDVEKIKYDLINIREYFHKHPELSFQEFKTSQKIAELLHEIGLDEIETGIAKTGVVGVLRGKDEGKTIAIRADIDALPIQEANDVPYKSQNDGVMHACGHDVHITSAIGSAMILSKVKDKLKGNVKFIFQPAEEIF